MRLPANKKERVQVLALIGIGCVVMLTIIVQFIVMPFLGNRKKLDESRAEYAAKLEKADRELKASAQIQEEFDDVTARLQAIAADYLLHPILGSYQVSVTEALEPRARDTGFMVENVQERGIQPIRLRAKDTSPRPYSSYSAQVNGQGSYAQTVAFLKAIEAWNPFVCVTEIKINGQPDSVERHRVSLRIEWPIETEPAAGARATAAPRGAL